VLGQSAPTDTNTTTLLTGSTATQYIVSSIVVANIGGNAGKKYDIAVRPDGEALANKHYLAKNVQLNAGLTENFTLGITLNASDVITVKSDTANEFAFNVFGVALTTP
jgi:hypothetical protein